MRNATIASLVCMVAALSGCNAASGPGNSVAFVASNPDSVLLDFSARPQGELVFANEAAAQQCQIFNRRTAVLESLNIRNDSTIRATYLCKNGVQTAGLQRRQ